MSLQNATKVYYKMRQVFYDKIRQFYYKIRHLLQNPSIFLQNIAVITKSSVYCKMRWCNVFKCPIYNKMQLVVAM